MSEHSKGETGRDCRLIDPDADAQFYHVEKEEGGTHLYSAGVMKQFERIEVSESRVWSEKTEVSRDG